MRRRVRKFLPIVVIALLVQILAPVVACWAAGIAASDPLSGAVICHDYGSSTSGQEDHAGQLLAHASCCSVCSLVHSGAPLATPQSAVPTRYGGPQRVVWFDREAGFFIAPTDSEAQARAPPLLT